MNLFEIGPLEIMVVAVIAMVVRGPELVPAVAVQIERVIKYLRRDL